MDSRTLRRAVLLCAGLALAGGAASAGPPPENRCPSMAGGPGASPGEDAAPTLLHEGMKLGYGDILRLGELLPPEVWRNRDTFFYEGMLLLIGPCHRRYPVPEFFTAATARFAGSAGVDDEGNLEGYVAGVPFPQDTIVSTSPEAGAMWAWNLEQRYRGAGPSGDFQIVDMPSRLGKPMQYRGSFFLLQTGHRADLPETEYAVPGAEDKVWVSGGRFDEPFDARHLAWRQLRPVSVQEDYDRSDETFVYIPTLRKVRRGATAWVDGVYTPRYRVGGMDDGGGLFAPTGGEYQVGGQVIHPAAGRNVAVSEHIPRGFTDLALRPNAYVWRLRGEREVLAPINAARTGYPLSTERNFGPSGLSVASDRWDVRWAVVIEGLARQRELDFDRIEIYVDYQTLVPLYIITKRNDGRLYDVGIPVHRFSGDTLSYPNLPDGTPPNVFDPVAAVFYNDAEGGSGWRRESYDVTSVPPPARRLESYLSTSALARGR